MQNAMIAWGLAAISGSFAWHYLASARLSIFVGSESRSTWSLSNLILGIICLALASFLTVKAVAGW
jgi:hypothetical protein